MNSQQLWLSIQDWLKIKPVNILALMGAAHEPPTPAEEPLTVDGCEGRESQFFKSM